MKKLFTIALMLLAQTVLFAAASVSIEQKTNAIPGALSVSVDANFSSVPQGVGAFTLYITYDNNVLDSPVLFNPVFAGIFSSTITSGTTTTITVLWEDFNAPTTLSGKLFDIGFNYKGGNSNLTILGSSSIGDANANLLNATFINGSVTQIAITPGISVNNGNEFNSLPYKTVDIPVYGHQLYNIGGFDLKLAISTAVLTGNVTIVNRRTDLTAKGSWSASYNSGNIFVIWTKNPALDNVSIPDGEKLFDIRFNYTYGNSNISFVGTTNQIAQNVPPFYPEFGNAYFTSGSIATTPANPTVTFPTVTTTITYGQTLADAGLNNNGSASYTGDPNAVAGTFAFQNPGLIPGAGTYQATVVFTPTNSVAYNSVTGTVNVVVNKANQTISWSNPAAITYGTLLSAVQLNATVAGVNGGSAPGALTYDPAIGTLLNAGSHTLNVTAAATDNYNQATANVTIVVNKANQTISWNNPAAITYGTLLSATQLNATVSGVNGGSAPGVLTYDPAIGTLLNAGPHTLNVTAAETDNYNQATENITIEVNKANQTISWNNPAPITYGTVLSATQLNATVAGVNGGSAPGVLTYDPAIGTLLNAGPHTLNVTAAATDNYNQATANVTIVVNKANQTISWNNPAAITYGTLLSATQLNAAVAGVNGGSAPGTLSYDPAIGTMPGAGTQTLNVTAAATDNYNETTAQVTIIVSKANQTINWSNPASITYGTLLSATQLNATVAGVNGGSAPGALTYNPAIGTLLNAGSHTLNVTAAATDNYNQATANVTIEVNKANQTISWNNPAAITYGTLLSATQLNATVAGVNGGSATGALSYQQAIGTLFNAGSHTLSVTAAATDNYNEANAQVSLVVNKANQTISWSNPAAITYGTLLSAAQLNATVAGVGGGSAPGALTYNPANGTLLGAGTHTLNVTAAATDNYNQATANVTIVVNKANQTISWSNPAAITYGTLLSAAQLNATVAGVSGGSAPGMLTYNPAIGTLLNAGSHTLNVTAAATDNYNQATANVTIVVNKANQTISWSNPAAITYGTLLSAAQLNATVAGVSGGSAPGMLTYNPAIGTLLNAGSHTLNVTAAATDNYNQATANVTIVVNKANQTISWSNPAAITYGTLLSAVQLNATVAGVSGGSAPGMPTYNPAIGTLLNAGSHTLNVTAAATDNYNQATKQVSILVDKAPTIVSVSGSTSFTYTGMPQGPSEAIVTGSTGAVSYLYSGSGNTVYPPSANKPVNEGTYVVVATVEGDANYLGATSPPFQFMIGVLISTIEVTGSVNYTYNGLAQGPSNATVTGSAGAISFEYTGIGNTVYGPTIVLPVNAGSYQVVATVAPDLNYSGASSAPFFFTIHKVNPTVSWPIPSDITYGTLLSNLQLNATATGMPHGALPGALVYSPAAGTLLPVGTHVLNVIVEGTINYNEVTAAVIINVGKGFQTINWSNPEAITYGTPLSATQLNAVVLGATGGTAPGALTYNPVAGTVLPAGTHTLQVAAASTLNYFEASAQVNVLVNKAPSTISVSGSTSFTYNGFPQGPSAAIVSGSTGAVSYLYSGIGNTIYPSSSDKPVNEGTYSVVATVAADVNYLSAVSEPFTFIIGSFVSFIEVTGASEYSYNGLPQGPINAVVNGSGGNISFEYSGTGNTNYLPTSVLPTNAGTYKVIASVDPDINFTGAVSAPFYFSILKTNQTITWPVPANIVYGELLSNSQLNAAAAGVSGGSAPGTLTYNPVAGTMLDAGTHVLFVTAAATENYHEAVAQVNIQVSKAPQSISWNTPEAIPFGTPLSSAQLNAIVTGISGGTAPGSLSYAPSAGTILSSGTHALTVTAAETVNYLASTFSVQIVVLEGTAASLAGQLKLFGDPGAINPFNYPNNFYVQLFDGDNPVGAPQLIQTGSQIQIQGLYQYHGLDITKNYTLRLWETSPDNLLSNTWTWNNWNGITALDAFIMQSMIIEGECLVHFPWIGLAPFSEFSEKLADVNNSGTLTALDPLIILYRVVGFPGTSPFPGGRHNFVFAGKKLETLNDCAFPNAPDIMFESFGNYQANRPANSVYHEAVIRDLVPGQNVINIYMNVAGDMNSSFTPCDLKSAPRIQYQQQINTTVGSVIDIPVMVDKGVNLNAVTIGLRYDKNLIRVNSVSGFELYNVNHDEGTVKIAWSNVQSKKMSDNEVLFYLNATILAEMNGNETYIELLPMTELVESGGLINNKTGLTTRSLSTLRDVDPSNTQAMIAHHFYPNPFNESGSLNISLPAKGKLNISLFNQYGQIVNVLTEEMAEAGMFNLQLNRAQLNGSGIYTYRIILQTDEKQFVGHGNVILLK